VAGDILKQFERVDAADLHAEDDKEEVSTP
jgi:hypothetical protein